MRRIIISLFILLIVLISCSNKTEVVNVSNIQLNKENPNETENKTIEINKTIEEAEKTTQKIVKKDLALANVLISTLYPKSNEPFEIKMTVLNNGSEEISNFEYSVEIYKEGNIVKQDRQTYEAKLDKNTSIKITRQYILKEGGDYTIKILVDPSNVIEEFDEKNNEKTIEISVSQSNITVSVTTNQTGLCSDSDGGKNYKIKGTCSGKNAINVVDGCIDSTLLEWYCDKYDNCQQVEYRCVCKEGACLT